MVVEPTKRTGISWKFSMRIVTLYGLACSKTDERLLIGRVNASLNKIKRTTSKCTNKSMLRSRLPYVLKHYYWNLNKDAGVYTEFYPNEDVKGQWHQPDHKDRGWLMMVILKEHAFRKGKPLKKTIEFVNRLLKAVEFDHTVLAEADDRHEIEPEA
jgi:hypothetical protein